MLPQANYPFEDFLRDFRLFRAAIRELLAEEFPGRKSFDDLPVEFWTTSIAASLEETYETILSKEEIEYRRSKFWLIWLFLANPFADELIDDHLLRAVHEFATSKGEVDLSVERVMEVTKMFRKERAMRN